MYHRTGNFVTDKQSLINDFHCYHNPKHELGTCILHYLKSTDSGNQSLSEQGTVISSRLLQFLPMIVAA